MIRPTQPDRERLTVEQYLQLVPDGHKGDLIDGVIHLAPSDTLRENQLVGLLVCLLDVFVGARRLGGEVFVHRFTFQMSGHDACEPDVGYVAPHRLHLLEQRYMRGAPDIAVEIVSRESHSRDYGEKREIYEQAGVGEYWILDPLRQSTQFLRLHDGRFEPAPLVKDRYFQSEVIPGFWLDVEWLFADELPNDYACLQSILAGPPDA